MAYTLKINSVDFTSKLHAQSLSISKSADNRHSCSFAIDTTASAIGTADGMYIGQEVEVLDGVTTLFGGVIKSINIEKLETGLGATKLIRLDMYCSDYNDICARRVTTINQSNKTGGELVTLIVNNVLNLAAYNDNVGLGTISTGATYGYYSATAKSVKDILDDLAESSGYKWYIDADKDLYFVQEDTIVDETNVIEEGGAFTDFNIINTNISLENYRNKQWVLGALDTTGAEVNVSAELASAITARATIEGNSGVYGDIIHATDAQSVTDATIVANNKLKLYGTIPYTVTFTSFTNTWVEGTRVTADIPTLGIPTGSKFLIENVTIVDLGGALVSTVTMTRREPSSFSTQRTENYKDYFAKLVSSGSTSSSSGGGSTTPKQTTIQSAIVLLAATTHTETFTFDAISTVYSMITVDCEINCATASKVDIVVKQDTVSQYDRKANFAASIDTLNLTTSMDSVSVGVHTVTVDITSSVAGTMNDLKIDCQQFVDELVTLPPPTLIDFLIVNL